MQKIQYYLVGGAVRDRLLGLPIKDRDWVVTGASPEQMQALGFRPVGKDFPLHFHSFRPFAAPPTIATAA